MNTNSIQLHIEMLKHNESIFGDGQMNVPIVLRNEDQFVP